MSANLEDFFSDLQKRGIVANVANLDNFYQLEPSQKVIYLGIDCTGESLHIGHLFLLIQTIRFAKEGFQILLILGGATSKIGDPSDKLKERPQLETEKLNQYYQTIKEQITRIVVRPLTLRIIKEVSFAPLELFFSDNQELLSNIYKILEIKKEDNAEKKWEKYLEYIWPLKDNKFRTLNNNDWLSQVNFIDFIDEVGRKIRVNSLIKKEFVKERIDSETGLSFLEFSYSLLQAYDFYYLYKNHNCYGQLGGSDQWGNLTVGIELIEKFYPEKKTKIFAFTFNLLTDKEGKKYSKSENGKKKLRLNDKREDLIDFFLNLSDEEIQTFIRQFTFLEERQIAELIKMPARLRILQRIMTELIYWLNYGEIKSLKNILEAREEKLPSGRRRIKKKIEKIILLQEKEELIKKIQLLRLQKETLRIQREVEAKEIEKKLGEEERNLLKLEYKIFNALS